MSQKIRVAIADDHVLFRKGMTKILQQSDYLEIILEAGNGQELIELIKTNLPDVILMDLQMPILDGIKATEHVKQHYPHVKVVVLSMHDEDNFVTHLMELGANGYLLKDTDPDEVEKAIRMVFEEDYYYGEFLTKVMHRRLLNRSTKREANKLTLTSVHLSEREIEILKLICEGFTNSEIAEKLFLSPRTVDGHRQRIMEKVGAKNTAGLVVYAVKNDLY
ncbi:MAG: response regulator transcription factor [Spirosomataceae bacterium]